jgi:hypothetical protein
MKRLPRPAGLLVVAAALVSSAAPVLAASAAVAPTAAPTVAVAHAAASPDNLIWD